MVGINGGNDSGSVKRAKRRYARLVSRRSFLGGGLAAIGATVAIAIPAGCQGRFYRGTTVLQFDLGGKSQALQTSAPGYNVSLTRTFSKNGEVVDRDTFVSHYQPQPEIWNIGVGSHD